tara:strand:- start:1347 stop:1520 length:174 start_codon:yes stop_codon:yes gene_type:complete
VNVDKSLKSIDAQKTLDEERLVKKRFMRNHLKALRDSLDENGLRFYSDHIHYLIKKL